MQTAAYHIKRLSRTQPKLYEGILRVLLVLVIIGGLYGSAHPISLSAAGFSQYQGTLPKAGAMIDGQPVRGDQPSDTPAAAVAMYQGLPPYGSLSGSTQDPKTLARRLNQLWFGDQYWPALEKLWIRESGWNPNSRNVSSGACGIPQALPCSKITDHSTIGQIEWGLDYIKHRYGNPANAWAHWQTHGWY